MRVCGWQGTLGVPQNARTCKEKGCAPTRRGASLLPAVEVKFGLVTVTKLVRTYRWNFSPRLWKAGPSGTTTPVPSFMEGKEEDRKRLLELFRTPLEEGDVITNPEVLATQTAIPLGPSMPSGSRNAPDPVYQGSGGAKGAPDATPSPSMPLILGVGFVVVLCLLGVIAWLLLRHPEPEASPGRPSALDRDADEEEDDDEEIAGITAAAGKPRARAMTGGSIPIREAPTARPPPTRGAGPPAGRMRPVDLYNDDAKAAAPQARRVDLPDPGDEDPMFQSLED